MDTIQKQEMGDIQRWKGVRKKKGSLKRGREGEEAAAESETTEEEFEGVRGGLWRFRKRQLLRK